MPAISVRMRLIAVITLVAAVGLAVVGVAVYSVERQRILAQVDERLAAHLESARFLVAQGPGGDAEWASSADALHDVVQRMSPDDNTGAMGVVDGAIALVPGVALDVDLAGATGLVSRVVAETADGDPVVGTFTDDGVAWRYLATPVAAGPAESSAGVFVMVYDLEGELAEIGVAGQVYLVSTVIAVLIVAAVAWFAAGRLLRPLRDMRRTAEHVSARSLSERIPVHGRDDVSDLARTMNDMLDRLDDALESQRSLVSDVGHELKTPITIVRGYLEVMDPDDPADVRETAVLAVDELERMGVLVQDLAQAAMLLGPTPITPHPTDAADLVRQIVRKAEGIDGAEVTSGRIADVVALVDPARITQALLQLAQNAVTHGGGRMAIGSRVAGDRLEIWVRDHGPGVPDEAKSQVFDRFRRGTDDREPAAAGSGLGLHIVDVIARAHGGAIRVVDADGGGAVFVITVPLVAAARPSSAGSRQVAPPGPPPPLPPAPPAVDLADSTIGRS